MIHTCQPITARRIKEIDMQTYAITLENGKIEYITASTAKQARIVWERAHNEKIVSVKACKEA